MTVITFFTSIGHNNEWFNKNEKAIMKKLIVLMTALIYSMWAYSAEYEITPYNDYKPEIIGKLYRFKVPMTYLVLTNSPPNFLKENNKIERLLTSVEMATGNDVHDKETLDENMIYEVASIFHVKDLSPPPEDWSEEDKQAYLEWLTTVEDVINVKIELRDENGVFSTVSAHQFKQSYDVTDDRQRIERPYTYELTQKVKEQLINYGKRMGDVIPDNETEFERYINTVVSPQVSLDYQMNILPRCESEISALCNDIYNVHEIIHCLAETSAQLTKGCKNSLLNVIGTAPTQQYTPYFDIEFPPGTTFFYRMDSTDTEPVITGAMMPDGETVSSQGVVYGAGRLSLYNGKVISGFLAHPQTIQGVPIKGQIDNDVQTGRLREGLLAEDAVLNGVEYAKDTKLLFRDSEKGMVNSGTLARTQIIEGTEIPADMIVYFDEQGILSSVFDKNFSPMEGFQSKSPGFN